jgi:sirohydrochlorin ferrochelatase
MPLILVAHGSRRAGAANAVWALAQGVASALPGARVRTAFLNVEVPRLPAALTKESGLSHPEVTVVPILLAAGRHARIALPDQIGVALGGGLPLAVRLAEPLGPVSGAGPDQPGLDLIVRALERRLGEALVATIGRHHAPMAGSNRPDAIVLAAAGSRSTRAMQSAAQVALTLGSVSGLPCRAAFTTNGTVTVREAIHAFHRRGAHRVAVATYLFAPGVLADRVADDASRAGALAMAAPLADAPEMVDLVLARARTAERVRAA